MFRRLLLVVASHKTTNQPKPITNGLEKHEMNASPILNQVFIIAKNCFLLSCDFARSAAGIFSSRLAVKPDASYRADDTVAESSNRDSFSATLDGGAHGGEAQQPTDLQHHEMSAATISRSRLHHRPGIHSTLMRRCPHCGMPCRSNYYHICVRGLL